MTVADGDNKRQIFTIGHSNHSWEAFLELLRENAITIVVDVRSSPYSRYGYGCNGKVTAKNIASDVATGISPVRLKIF
jgi:hypothetical protein